MTVKKLFVGGALCLALGACDEVETIVEDGTPIDDEVTFRTVVDNGVQINGPQINGIRYNGVRYNGVRYNGVRYNGVRYNGVRYNGTEVSGITVTQGSKPRAIVNAVEVAGSALEDTEVELDYQAEEHGEVVEKKTKITRVTQSAVDPDVYFTEVKVRTQVTPEVWEHMCTDGAGNPTEAIALTDTWDEVTGSRGNSGSAVTWACRGAALAKAVEWGYTPWRTHLGWNLSDFHQAAVRMIRADYCGNGVTHTVNGNPIDVSDRLGIQTPGTSWPVEAKWGPDGAVCLNTPRRAAWTRAAIIAECQAAGRGTLPTCSNSDPSEHGALLMTQANAL